MDPVSLYGGAIRTVFPPGFIDASLLRPVPDTQEVFVNGRQEGENYGDELGFHESITVDLLERVDAPRNEDALKEHVTEIFDLNGSANCQMDLMQRINSTKFTCIAHDGKLLLCVGLIRLTQYGTDAVVTINVPGQELRAGEQLPREAEAANKALKTILDQFQVVDSSLFV